MGSNTVRILMASTDLVPAPALGGIVSAPALGEQAEQRSNLWWVAVLALTLLSLALRVFAIEHDSLWFDEAVTAQYTRVPVLDLITGRVYDLGNPSLYWILARLWSTLFGDSEAGLRSFPALCGILTVPFLALLGRQLISPKVGLWGAFLLAISPTAIELSNEARPLFTRRPAGCRGDLVFRSLGGEEPQPRPRDLFLRRFPCLFHPLLRRGGPNGPRGQPGHPSRRA